jgi:hypothetical protein
LSHAAPRCQHHRGHPLPLLADAAVRARGVGARAPGRPGRRRCSPPCPTTAGSPDLPLRSRGPTPTAMSTGPSGIALSGGVDPQARRHHRTRRAHPPPRRRHRESPQGRERPHPRRAGPHRSGPPQAGPASPRGVHRRQRDPLTCEHLSACGAVRARSARRGSRIWSGRAGRACRVSAGCSRGAGRRSWR